jgi:hypothetical protein
VVKKSQKKGAVKRSQLQRSIKSGGIDCAKSQPIAANCSEAQSAGKAAKSDLLRAALAS